MGVEPDDAARRAVGVRKAAERADGDCMVAADDERDPPGARGRLDLACELLARPLDRIPVAGRRVAHVERLHHAGTDVAPVVQLVPQRLDPLSELCVAHGRRAHVDSAPARTEVEGGADDGDRGLRFGLCGHGSQERR